MREIPWYVSFATGIAVGFMILSLALDFGPKENRYYIQGRGDGMKRIGYEKVQQSKEVWVKL